MNGILLGGWGDLGTAVRVVAGADWLAVSLVVHVAEVVFHLWGGKGNMVM